MEIFKLDKAIENEKLDLEMAIAQLKEAKEKHSISKKKEGTYKSDEWSLVHWKKDWRFSPLKKFRSRKQCNQRTPREEWIPARRNKKTQKRTRDSVNKIMWNLRTKK